MILVASFVHCRQLCDRKRTYDDTAHHVDKERILEFAHISIFQRCRAEQVQASVLAVSYTVMR